MPDKTWAQLDAEIRETFRKWDTASMFAIDAVLAQNGRTKQRALRQGQTLEERQVTLRFQYWDAEQRVHRQVKLLMQREPRAIDNLRLLAQAVEWLRMAEVREISSIVRKLYRQMYAEPEKAVPPPLPPPKQEAPPRTTGPYAVLHIANDAPIEVAEAAYRALVKASHPDAGGTHVATIALNAAIEQIRAKHAAG